MASELWKRLRAARNYAELRQQDIADVCGVSRGAVAQWERDDPTKRTTPSTDHLKAVAKRTKVPLTWLLDDNANLDDIWQPQLPITPPVPNPQHDDLFLQAVQFEVTQERPDLASGFARSIGQSPFAVQPDFLWDKVAIELKPVLNVDSAAKLLLTEQASGRRLQKHLILLDRNGAANTQHLAAMLQTFGVAASTVRTAQEGAKKLIEICS